MQPRSSVPLLCASVLTLVATPALAADAVEIVFATGPDDSGAVERLVASFNDAHRGEVHVEWRQLARESDAHRAQLAKELAGGSGAIDLMATDVIWTAELAHKGRVLDLTRRFYADFDRDDFLSPALDSATHRLRQWGVPWVTDAGMLFYRTDKLASSGFKAPPATWAELGKMAKKVMKDSGTKHGFVFQGAAYEGGAVNAAEYIWSAGGEIVTTQLTVTGLVVTAATETDVVQVDTAQAARGLDIARKLVADGVTPAAVTGFREKESLDAFARGDAVFLRSWPYAYGALRASGLRADQIGVAPLPAASAGGRSASCLGGWNLMINASSTPAEQDAAWELIRHLTDPAQQRRAAQEAALLPVLTALYDDDELMDSVPVLAVGKQVFTSQLHARPKSPFYSDMSASIAKAFNQTLSGQLTGAEAVSILDAELRGTSIRNR